MLLSDNTTGQIVGIAPHVKLPRSIEIATIEQLLHKLEVVSTLFIEGSIIGFLDHTEDATCSYNVPQSKTMVESVLSKNIKSSPNDEKEIKHASTELLYKEEIAETLIKYQDIVNYIESKSGTPDESVVLCCMKRTNNPVSYNVVTGGPLDTKEGVKQGFSASESCDLMFFGPVYSSLHADTRYSHRNSLIPSWNVGVVKFWIIRKECDAEMNRKIPSRFRQRSSKAFKPIHDLDKVLKATKDYVLLIQRPGQMIRHYGRHVHCVITAIDPITNPTGLSISIGRKDENLKDILDFATGSVERLIPTANGSKQTSRNNFVNVNLKLKDKKVLREVLKKKEHSRKRKVKPTSGFQVGNDAAKRKKSVDDEEDRVEDQVYEDEKL